MTPQNYDTPFFKLQQSQSYKSAGNIVPLINEWIKPSSVTDIGCGVGAWLKAFKDLGIQQIRGLDGDYVDMANLLIEKNEFVVADLEKPIQLNNTCDLVVCLEVAEHLSPKRADGFIADLCKAGEVVLFSAAIPGQEGTLHINEQYPAYWISKFEKNDFECIDCIRPVIWNNTGIEFWYKQNMMLFVKKEEINTYASLKQLPSFFGNNMIHPELFDYKTNKTDYYLTTLKNPFKALPFFLKSVFKAIKK